MENSVALQLVRGWRVIAGSALGVSVAHAAVAFLSFGVFIRPLSEEFGWGRGHISLALTLAQLVLAGAAPLVGRLVDRVGSALILYPSMLLWSVCFASLSLLDGSLIHFYAVFLVAGVLGLGASTLIYTRTIAASFKASRGLALGLATSGVSISAIVIPLTTQILVDTIGWRATYVALGVTVIVTMPVIAILLRGSWASSGQELDRREPAGARGNSPKGSAKYSRSFLLIAGSAGLAAMGIHALTIHLIPLLVDRGAAATSAALVASVMGVGMLVGRISCGYFMDRFFAPWVTIAFFLGPVTALLLFYGGTSGPSVLLCGLLLGMGNGAEVDSIAYLASRYFRLEEFGARYGWFYGCMMVGSSIGPLLMGFGFDETGSYQLPLLGSLIALLIACGLLGVIEPYPIDLEKDDQGHPLGDA